MGLKYKTKPGYCILLLYLRYNNEEVAGLKMFAHPWDSLNAQRGSGITVSEL